MNKSNLVGYDLFSKFWIDALEVEIRDSVLMAPDKIDRINASVSQVADVLA